MIALTDLSWVLAVGNVVAIALIQRRADSPVGWAFSLVWQLPWAVYSVATGQYGFLLLSVAYSVVYGMGMINRSQNSGAPMARCSRCLRDWPEDPNHPGWAGLHPCPGIDAPFDRCEAVLDMPARRTGGRLRTTYRCDLQRRHPGDHHVAFPVNATFARMRERGW